MLLIAQRCSAMQRSAVQRTQVDKTETETQGSKGNGEKRPTCSGSLLGNLGRRQPRVQQHLRRFLVRGFGVAADKVGAGVKLCRPGLKSPSSRVVDMVSYDAGVGPTCCMRRRCCSWGRVGCRRRWREKQTVSGRRRRVLLMELNENGHRMGGRTW